MTRTATIFLAAAALLAAVAAASSCGDDAAAVCNNNDAQFCEDDHAACVEECESDAGVDTECLVDCKTSWCDCLDSGGCDEYLADLGC